MRILNTEPGRFSPSARDALRALGTVENHEADRRFLLDRAEGFDVWFVGLRNVLDADVLARSGRLRWIVTPTTGTDHIDLRAARERGIDVLSLKGETAFLEGLSATAELTWGLLLALVRRIPAAHRSVIGGEWSRDRFPGRELRDQTLGVVGFGRLGRMVASYGQAFGMRVLAYDHHTAAGGAGVEAVGFDELLRRSDVVSLHVPLTEETTGMIGRAQIAAMKPGALLINTARGKVVDEAALLDALRSGALAGAALDVLAEETSTRDTWLAGNALRAYAAEHDTLLITPHIGGLTAESAEKANQFMIAKLARQVRATEEAKR